WRWQPWPERGSRGARGAASCLASLLRPFEFRRGGTDRPPILTRYVACYHRLSWTDHAHTNARVSRLFSGNPPSFVETAHDTIHRTGRHDALYDSLGRLRPSSFAALQVGRRRLRRQRVDVRGHAQGTELANFDRKRDRARRADGNARRDLSTRRQ